MNEDKIVEKMHQIDAEHKKLSNRKKYLKKQLKNVSETTDTTKELEEIKQLEAGIEVLKTEKKVCKRLLNNERSPHQVGVSRATKGRYFVMVVYPDSAPEGWKDMLEERGVAYAISPLHDKDIEADGKLKKAHYHVLLVWNNTTTWGHVDTFSQQFNTPPPEYVFNVEAKYKYLTHKDQADKVKYAESDIKHGNGFDILSYKVMTKNEEALMSFAITTLANELKITYFNDLLQVAWILGLEEYELVSTKCNLYNQVLRKNYAIANEVKEMKRERIRKAQVDRNGEELKRIEMEDQASAQGYDISSIRSTYDDIKLRLSKFDNERNQTPSN